MASSVLLLSLCLFVAGAFVVEDGRLELDRRSLQLEFNLGADCAVFEDALARVTITLENSNTIFAPTDAAFARIDQTFLERILTPSWIMHLQNLIEGHIDAEGPWNVADLQSAQQLVMLNGEIVTVARDNNDGTVSLQSEYNETSALITDSGLTSIGSPVHKLDFFLQPFFFNTGILELGPFYPEFSILYSFVESIGLGSDLIPDGVYATVLAPTDDAFIAAYGSEGVDRLRDPSNGLLLQLIVLNHAIINVFPTVQLSNGQVINTLGGNQLEVTKNADGTIAVGEAIVILSDVLANNGIVHAIDRLLGDNPLPPLAPPVSPPVSPPTPTTPVIAPPSPAPLPAPVSAPATTAPVSAPAPAPTTAPISAPVPVPVPTPAAAPVSAPVPAPVSAPAVTDPAGGDFVLENDSDLVTFLQDLTDSGVAGNLLSLNTNYTAFAPVNEAFGEYELIARFRMQGWVVHYRNLMESHILLGPVTSPELRLQPNNTEVEMLSGQTVTFSFDNDTDSGSILLSAESSKTVEIIGADLIESSGNVYHKIDGVLLPSFVGTNLLDVFEQISGFSILFDLLDRVTIPGNFLDGAYTIFAPTDDALLALGTDELGRLAEPENLTELQTLMLAHVFIPVIPAADLESGTTLTSLGGFTVTVTSGLELSDSSGVSRIVQPDILAYNGIAHGINRVFGSSGSSTVQESLQEEDDLSIFSSALFDSSVLTDLSFEYLTIFAPVNSSFATLNEVAMLNENFVSRLFTPNWIMHLQNLLKFHITQGGLSREDLTQGQTIPMVNGDVVTVEADGDQISLCSYLAQCSVLGRVLAKPNGVIHKIDAVMLPEFVVNGIETLGARTENVTIFMDLIERAGYESDSQGSSVFTLFAPNDEALLALGNETLAYLADPANFEDLLDLISNHLVDEVYPSSLLQDGETLRSLGGLPIDVTRSDDRLSLNGATVQSTDILFRNGIGHVVDRVMTVPPTEAPAVAPPPTPPMSGALAPTSAASRWTLAAVLVTTLSVAMRNHVW